MSPTKGRAARLHQNVPADWYARSIRENLLQRFWHHRRFSEVSRLIEKTTGKILDIGSADGTFTKVILDSSGASKIIGIDVLESSVSYARRRFARSKRLSFKVADAHNLPFGEHEFDAVFCLETLEHVENPVQVVAEINRVLKKSGHVVILVPSENWLFRFVVWPLWTLWRGKIWRGTHLHRFTADQVIDILEQGGFSVVTNEKFLLGMLQAVKARKNKHSLFFEDKK